MSMLYPIATVIVGILLHLTYFNRGEHHFQGWLYVQIVCALFVTGVALDIRLVGGGLTTALFNITTSFAYVFMGLYGSLLFYRCFNHPLNKIPGPFFARMSNFWFSSQILGKADAFRQVTKLHEKYGDFVRIGSNDLTILDPRAVDAIYGPGSKCERAGWYDQDHPLVSMITMRSRAMHNKRRKEWAPAFSDKALRGYEHRIRRYGDALVKQITAFYGKSVNVTRWFNFYTFDVMSDLSFGESLGMLDKGEAHFAVELLHEGEEVFHPLFAPWLFRMAINTPGLAAGYWKLTAFTDSCMEKRIGMKPDIPDVASVLLEPFQGTRPVKGDLTLLQADARLLVVAGSDTTSIMLTALFYRLCQSPHHMDLLRAELAPYVDENGDVKNSDITQLPHLNACINETMRLHPAVPTAIQRITPPEGIRIGDVDIPGHTTVWCPPYALGRSAAIYAYPNDFIPERWTTRPELMTTSKAFFPFSAGTYGCIGKPLALMELRTITAKLLTKFNVSFAEGETGERVEGMSRDHFTIGLGVLECCFTPRK